VKINKKVSDPRIVTSGVPQGSVLGPLLFIIYIFELAGKIRKISPLLNVFKFADDIKIFISYSFINRNTAHSFLQDGILATENYFKKLQLKISLSKTKVLYIGNANPRYQYMFDNEDLVSSDDTVRDLGVFMSHNLKFSDHISTIIQRARIAMFRILKIFNFPNHELLCRLYTVYIRPILEYATVIWSPFLKKDIELVENVQHTYTRILYYKCLGTNRDSLPEYGARLQFLRLETLEYRRKLFDILQTSKIVQGESRISFGALYRLRPSSERINSFGIHIPFTTQNKVFNCFHCRTSRLLQSKPQNIFRCKKLKELRIILELHDVLL
jgi:hypothetical protein